MSTEYVTPPRDPRGGEQRKWLWVAIAAVGVLGVGAVIGTGKDSAGPTRPAAAPITTTTAPTTTTTPAVDPAVAASSSSAAKASRDASASLSASRSSEAARQSSEAAEAQRKADEEAERKANTIIYSVSTTGSGINMVTYLKPGFNISQETEVKGKKWSKTIVSDGDRIGINMNAQNSGGGTITCRIARGDGTVISENSSSGQYAMVTCG